MAKNIDKDGWIDTTNDKVAASYIRRGADKILQKIYDDGHRDGTRTVVSPDYTSSTQIYVSPQHTAKQALITNAEKQALQSYTEKLHKWGYIDSDFYTEEPSPIDRYFKELEEL